MPNKKDRKDLVIACLEFARSQLIAGKFTDKSELHNHLLEIGAKSNMNSIESHELIDRLYSQIFTINQPGQYQYSKYMMGLEAYMGLLSFEELEHARADSVEARIEARIALRWAKYSLWFAAAVGIAQIVVSIISIPRG